MWVVLGVITTVIFNGYLMPICVFQEKKASLPRLTLNIQEILDDC